jgi:hypothetical protein
MLEFIQNNPQVAAFIGILCGGLCVVGMVLFFGMQMITGIFQAGVNLFATVIGGGPVSWCGCLVVLILLIGCAGVSIWGVSVLTNCGTTQRIILCDWLGR